MGVGAGIATRRRHVKSPGAPGGQPVECVWHPFLGKKVRKNKYNPCTGFCRIYSRSFLDHPIIKRMGEEERELPFLVLQAVGCGGDASWIVSVHGFTCKVK